MEAMIAAEPNPFIFIHIPKCAGTSIERALTSVVTEHKGFETMSEKERAKFWLPGVAELQHAKLSEYERQFKLHHYLKFAFVRNPWDRAVSQIDFLRSVTGTKWFSGSTFKEHVKVYCTLTRNIWAHDLAACQMTYLRNKSGKIGVDFIGRFESLLDDFAKLCRMLGFQAVPDLPHIYNSRRRQHYSAFYDTEAATWIRKRFAMDIDMLGYEFEEGPGLPAKMPLNVY